MHDLNGDGRRLINPDLFTYADELQYAGYLQCVETNAIIMKLTRPGVPIQQIVRRRLQLLTGHQVVRGQRTGICRLWSLLKVWVPVQIAIFLVI